jgi:hypothetical protein
MTFRIIILALCLFGLSCGERETAKTAENKSSPTPEPLAPAVLRSGNSDFDQFLERFNKDSAFQAGHIQYPLRFQQYDRDRAKTVVVAVPREAMQFMDFSKTNPSEWTQYIQTTPGSTKATIQIRGVASGMVIDYYFEKINTNWMLVLIDDQST